MAENEKTARGARILAGGNLALYTLVFLAIVVVVNWFVSQHDRHWDLTPNKQYSLSPQTLKLLKGLDRSVTIYAFDHKEGFRESRDLLNNYSAGSRRVTVQYVDPDREPGLAKQYNIRTYGTIVVAAGDRHFEAPGQTEEGVTNALIRVLKGQKTVYFVEGHKERSLDDTERAGYDRLKKALTSESYDVKTLTLMPKNEIPSDCALLVIAGPQYDYVQPEVEAIEKYVKDGGRLLAMVDPGIELPNLGKMLADWNVTLQNDLVIDENPVAQLFGTSPTMPVIMKYGSSPIVQPLQGAMTLFPFARSFVIGKDAKAGATDDSLCETSTASFGVADFNPKMEKVSFRPDKDHKGPLTVAVAGTLTGGKSEGRFVALGTSSLPANVYLSFQANRDFFMNAVNWLGAEEDLISIRPKPPESQHLVLTAAQMSKILYLGVIGLPLFIILIGVSVWWGRR
ncbi:MAG TPA: GldG family protein [Terriglobia bacterium]|nr:GldG family protein [Terriglobia bacterium]